MSMSKTFIGGAVTQRLRFELFDSHRDCRRVRIGGAGGHGGRMLTVTEQNRIY